MILKKEIENLNRILKELGYTVEKTDLTASEALLIKAFDDDEPFVTPVVINCFPYEDESEQTTFIQFYFQYSGKVTKEGLRKFSLQLIEANKKLPLGHFNFSESESCIYFKYVLVVPRSKAIETNVIASVMDMVIYILETYSGEF
jgi:hypothetical protein